MYETWSIAQWQRSFRVIYGHRNQKAGAVYVGLRLLEEIGEVVQSVRYYRTTKQTLALTLPDIFAWLCAFCDVTGVSLEDAVWVHYQTCPYCGRLRNCVCGPNPLGMPRSRHGRTEGTVPPTPLLRYCLLDWETRLDHMYGERNNTLEAIDLIARLTDHIGRLAKALRKGATREALAPLAADVFAWMVAIWNGQRSAVSELPSFAELVARKYDGRCPACMQSRCTCSELARMFISSSMADDDARALRGAARTTLAALGLQSTGFEDVPLKVEYSQQVEALRLLSASDGVLVIIDRAPSAAVRGEIELAIAERKPVWVAVRRVDGRVPEECADFVEQLQRVLFTEHFTSVTDLPAALQRLGTHRSDEIAAQPAQDEVLPATSGVEAVVGQ